MTKTIKWFLNITISLGLLLIIPVIGCRAQTPPNQQRPILGGRPPFKKIKKQPPKEPEIEVLTDHTIISDLAEALGDFEDTPDVNVVKESKELRELTNSQPLILKQKVEAQIFTLYKAAIKAWWKFQVNDKKKAYYLPGGLRRLSQYSWCLYSRSKDSELKRQFEDDWANLIDQEAGGSVYLMGTLMLVGRSCGVTAALVPDGLRKRAESDPLVLSIVLNALRRLSPHEAIPGMKALKASPNISEEDKKIIDWNMKIYGTRGAERQELEDDPPDYYRSFRKRWAKIYHLQQQKTLEMYKATHKIPTVADVQKINSENQEIWKLKHPVSTTN